LTEEETKRYIFTQWVSEDFLPSDLISNNNHQQPITYINPRFTFFEKFLEKRRQRLVVKELIDQEVLPLNCVKPNTFTLDFIALSAHHLDIISDVIQKILYKGDDNDNKKTLQPQTTQSIPTSFEFPTKFMDLLELEVFSHSNSSVSKSLWKEFALWACFKIGPNFIQKLRHHCRLLWSKTQCVYQHIKVEDKPLQENNIYETFFRNPKDKLYIADKTTKEIVSGINLEGYRHIFEPQCFKNSFGETIVDFFDLDNQIAVEDARIAVDQYYQHTLSVKSHQSKQFKKDLIEHFGGFADSNNMPYTTANTTSSHCKEHQKCVQNLIQGLQPISGSVNKHLETTYPVYYSKMKKLDLGPNAPKSFGAFPTAAINFNIICQFHRDMKDHRNSLCVVCPLGNFKGGELTFPELKLVIHVKQGQAVAFRSNILVHGNLPVITGIRHSLVFYIHNTLIKQKRKFGSLFADCALNWNDDNNRDEPKPKYLPPMLDSGNSMKLKNHRRTHIGMCNLYI
jgi:hypothetical protein